MKNIFIVALVAAALVTPSFAKKHPAAASTDPMTQTQTKKAKKAKKEKKQKETKSAATDTAKQ